MTMKTFWASEPAYVAVHLFISKQDLDYFPYQNVVV